MLLFNYLLISFLLSGFLTDFQPEKSYGCGAVSPGIVTEKQANGKFTITLKPEGGTEPYEILIWTAEGELLSTETSKREYSNLSTGKYEGIISDKLKCGKKFNVLIP